MKKMKKLNILLVGLIFLCLVNTAAAAVNDDEIGNIWAIPQGGCGGVTWNGNLFYYAIDWLENCYGFEKVGMEG